MWALHITKTFTAQELVRALNDPDEYIRAWAIQFLCEDLAPSPEAISKFIKMAGKDDSAVVRLYLAAALQRVPENSAWEIVAGLLSRKEDVDDHNIPKMIWFGFRVPRA